MSVREIMTANPACCRPDSSLQQVARLMVEHDCGEIPVVDAENHVLGVVTDRDICCRAVAEGVDCSAMNVSEVMTSPAVTVTMETSIDECCQIMEEHMIRRVPVVDQNGCCCGIVSQADFAAKTEGGIVNELVREISMPTQASANL